MKSVENLQAVLHLSPDFVGFIFYDKSPRFMGKSLHADDVKKLVAPTKKVGVFVNASVETILTHARAYDLDVIQLHGHEPVAHCRELKKKGLEVIKVFHIGNEIDWKSLEDYVSVVDYFLFDTKSKKFGGTGKQFDWQLLNNYPFDIPYFLSGGINLKNLEALEGLGKNKPFALDVNSQFEIEPGLKDLEKLKLLKAQLLLFVS